MLLQARLKNARLLLQSWRVCLCIAILMPVNLYAQWIEKPGSGWLQVSFYHHNTQSRFDSERSIEPLFNEEGRSITTSLIFNGVVGVYRGVDVWAQMPVHRLSFNDIAARRESFGLGDPRIYLRIGPELWGQTLRVPVALRGGIKFPVGDFPVDSEIVPLSEGQTDFEVILEAGYSFYPYKVYLVGWIGYRWRNSNNEIERKPGDESFGYLAIGGAYRKLIWKVALEGQLGQKWESFTGTRIVLAESQRELVQVQPALGWQVGQGVIELGVRIPVAGRNLPAGPALFAGYFYSWSKNP